MNVSPASVVSSVLKSLDRYKAYFDLDSILDIGAGRGIYGYYIRSYYDSVNPSRYHIQIDAVEPKPPKLIYCFYNTIFTNRIEDIIDQLDNYDVILALHILEHLKKKDALKVLEKCQTKADLVIFGVPSRIVNLKPNANDINSHKCFFDEKEIIDLGGYEVNIKSQCKVYEFTRTQNSNLQAPRSPLQLKENLI